MADEQKPFDGDDFALRFVDQAIASWVKFGLPMDSLGAALTVKGLGIATAEDGPTEVAEALQRIADAITEQEPPKPKHLV